MTAGGPDAGSDPGRCPSCGGGDVVPIVYGFPAGETQRQAQRGEIVLGGCCVFPDPPTHECRACGRSFGRPEDEAGSGRDAPASRGTRGPPGA